MNRQDRLQDYGEQKHKRLCPGSCSKDDEPLCNLINTKPFSWCDNCPIPDQMADHLKEVPFSMQVCFKRDINSQKCDICTNKRAGKGKSCFKPHRISIADRLRRRKARRWRRSLAKQKLIIDEHNERMEESRRRNENEI